MTPDNAKRARARVVVLGPGEETGQHTTVRREEIILPLDGKILLQVDGKSTYVDPGKSAYIGEGVAHNLKNPGVGPVRYLYVLSCWEDYEVLKQDRH
jgi:quercetin dioxygenase-like cupin family protein